MRKLRLRSVSSPGGNIGGASGSCAMMVALRSSRLSLFRADTGTMAAKPWRAPSSCRYGSSRARGRSRSLLLTATRAGARRAGGADAPQRQVVLGSPASRFHHEYHEVSIVQGAVGGAVHGLVEGAAGLGVQPGGVDEGDLRLRHVEDADDAVAGGLRPRRDDAQAYADQRIQQRRLADVGPADERGEAAAERRRGRRR